MPLIQELQSIFLKREEWIGLLPRKFNTAILGNGVNDCNIFGHDCCFVPAKRGETLGFNLYLGGKVGVQATDSGLFVEPQQVKGVFEALITLFKTYGFRDNRNKNRLYFLIEAVGIGTFVQTLVAESGYDLAPSGTLLLTVEHRIGNDGGVPLDNDQHATLFPIPSGVFNGSDLIEAAATAKKLEGSIRLSVEQSFYMLCATEKLPLLKASPLYEKYARFQNLYFTHQIACAGVETCSFGVIPNKPDAIEMASFLNGQLPLDGGKIRMHWSACPKGCGIHGIADIGFEGCKAKDPEGTTCYGVHIFVGGKASFEAKEARLLYKAIPLTDAKAIVANIVALYRDQRLPQESFEAFDTRVLSSMDDDTLREAIAGA